MKLAKRRRRERKTDYNRRLNLLKGERPRVVFRKTNKYIISQYITSKEAQDKIEFGLTSKELMKYGWPKEAEGSLKSITAAYLTGFLFGKKIIKEKRKSPILDIGMIRALHKGKVFAFVNGLIDAGLDIECDKKLFPEKERIQGKQLKNKIPFNDIKSKIEMEK